MRSGIQRHFGRRLRLPIRYKLVEEDHTSTPARLRARAAELRARAEAQFKALHEEAAALERAANDIEAVRAKGRMPRDQDPALQDRVQQGIVSNVTASEVGLAIARGHSEDPLSKAANAAGYTMRRLAERVSLEVGRKVTKSTLLMGRKERPIRRDVTEAVERLTGFASSAKNWRKIED